MWPSGWLMEPQCGCFDFDRDEDVDLLDFARFQGYFTGALP